MDSAFTQIQQSSPTLPRNVPLSLRLPILFGGGQSVFRWIFFIVGLLLTVLVFTFSEASTFWKFIGPLSTARGMITRVHATRLSQDETTVYAVDYTFSLPGGKPVNGISYSSGKYHTGRVTVEYRTGHPHYSRIHGLRSAPIEGSGWAGLVVLIFPGIGLGLILAKFIPGLRSLRLLRYGLPAVGTLVAMEHTGYRRHEVGPPICRLTFRFNTAEGKHGELVYTTDQLKPAWRIFYNQTHGITADPLSVGVMTGALSKLGKIMPAVTRRIIETSLAVAQAAEPPAESELQETVLYLPDNPTVATLARAYDVDIYQ